MPPEFNGTYIPPEQAIAFKEFVKGIPGAKLGMETESIDEFSPRVTEVLSLLNPDEVRLVDLDVAKNIHAQSRRGETGLVPNIPPKWQEFYDSLDVVGKSRLGKMFKPLFWAGLASTTLSKLRGKILEVNIFSGSETNQQLTEEVLGVKIENFQRPKQRF